MQTRLLIVEDDATLQKHLARLFVREGYAVTTAANRATALGFLAGQSFDVLLLDLQLPDGNGFDLLAALDVERPPPRAVVMTAYSTSESERHAQRLNVWRLLRKPVDLLELLHAVNTAAAKAVAARPPATS